MAQHDSDSNAVLQQLAIGAVIRTASSFAVGEQPPGELATEIGKGLQGAIFERVGHTLVVKKEHMENARSAQNLKNEFAVHQRVHASFQHYAPLLGCCVSVPRPVRLVTSDEGHIHRSIVEALPNDVQSSSDVVEMERVLPLPKTIRRALIERFYPEKSEDHAVSPTVVQGVLGLVPNKHCLVRPYVGMGSKTYTQAHFSLRNFILSLQSLRDLGFDVEGLATTLGKAYAIMHWGAHVDGDDVEFVLGSSTTDSPDSQEASLQSREISLHLLDFGQCEMVDMSSDPQVVYQAFKGAMVTGDNAYFIPNHRLSPGLFQAFVEAYSQAADEIIRDQSLSHAFDISEFTRQYREYVEDFL